MATIALTRPLSPFLAGNPTGLGLEMDALDPVAASLPQPQSEPQSPPSSPTAAAAAVVARVTSAPPPPPVPNKHIPVCPPGLPTATTTPSPSPPLRKAAGLRPSLLFPPDAYPCTERGPLGLYRIDAAGVVAALDYLSRQPLPDPALVFPWLHGLHPENRMQHAFFSQRRRIVRGTPCCLRGITVVCAGPLDKARLKGAVAADEVLQPGLLQFLDCDPREGFSVRNFQIQVAKTATTSDIVVYGDDLAAAEALAWDIAAAQQAWRDKHIRDGLPLPEYNIFLCTSPFSDFETRHPAVVAVDARGEHTGHVVDLPRLERREMYAMAVASEISHNVWLGPTPDPLLDINGANAGSVSYDVFIECSDFNRLSPRPFQALAYTALPPGRSVRLDFPASGSLLPPSWSQTEADDILETCKWLYHIAHGTAPSDAVDAVAATAGPDGPQPPRKVLIHCSDGYTESTLLAVAYFSYSTGRTIPEAWLDLHTAKRRNFFAYPSDVVLLNMVGPRLLCESPACASADLETLTTMLQREPAWYAAHDGSFPSRILDYMYLGNLNHANNPALLKALGITQILSVGEMAAWRDGTLEAWGEENVCVVQGVQDNGIDPLTDEFQRCLQFLDQGRKRGTATLVHCRVGVSRSATICIAEVMRTLHLSLPRAYCFVRARRLNVIIQPHLRFAYELLKWEEALRADDAAHSGSGSNGQLRAAHAVKRELEWGELAREVALMNRPYCR